MKNGKCIALAMRGAGWESRTPVQSLENFYINRYTNPAKLKTMPN